MDNFFIGYGAGMIVCIIVFVLMFVNKEAVLLPSSFGETVYVIVEPDNIVVPYYLVGFVEVADGSTMYLIRSFEAHNNGDDENDLAVDSVFPSRTSALKFLKKRGSKHE